MLIGYYFNEYYKLNLDISEISLTGGYINSIKIYLKFILVTSHPQLNIIKRLIFYFYF